MTGKTTGPMGRLMALFRQSSAMWRRGSRRVILLSRRTNLRAETMSITEIDEASHKRKHRDEGFNLLLAPAPIDVDHQSAPAATPGHQTSIPLASDPAAPQEIDGVKTLMFAVSRSIRNGECADDPEAMSVWTATRRHVVPGRPSEAQRQHIQHASQNVVAEVLIFSRDELGFASGRLVEKRQLLTLYATQLEWEAFLVESLANGWTKITGQRL